MTRCRTRHSPSSFIFLLSLSLITNLSISLNFAATAGAHSPVNEEIPFRLAQSWGFHQDLSASNTLLLTEHGAPGDLYADNVGELRVRASSDKVLVPRGEPSVRKMRRRRLHPFNAAEVFGSHPRQQLLSSDAQNLISQGGLEAEALAPNVSDRFTLLNLARAAWDAYHPQPGDGGDWLDVDGLNWVCIFFS